MLTNPIVRAVLGACCYDFAWDTLEDKEPILSWSRPGSPPLKVMSAR